MALTYVTLTHQKLGQLLNACTIWLSRPPAEQPERFAYAVRKVRGAAQGLWQNYIEQVEDIQVKHAEEAGGVLKRDDKGNLEYSKSAFLVRNRELRALSQTKVEIPAHFVKIESVPADLTADELDAFEGILIQVVNTPPEA